MAYSNCWRLSASEKRVVFCYTAPIFTEVFFIHVLDHGPWLPVTQGMSGAWLFLLRSGLMQLIRRDL